MKEITLFLTIAFFGLSCSKKNTFTEQSTKKGLPVAILAYVIVKLSEGKLKKAEWYPNGQLKSKECMDNIGVCNVKSIITAGGNELSYDYIQFEHDVEAESAFIGKINNKYILGVMHEDPNFNKFFYDPKTFELEIPFHFNSPFSKEILGLESVTLFGKYTVYESENFSYIFL